MNAYVMLDIQITDKEKFLEYQQLAPATVAQYNGKFIVKGGQITQHEGDWEPSRMVVIEFPTRNQAEEWLESEEYKKAAVIRRSAAKTSIVIVDGM